MDKRIPRNLLSPGIEMERIRNSASPRISHLAVGQPIAKAGGGRLGILVKPESQELKALRIGASPKAEAKPHVSSRASDLEV